VPFFTFVRAIREPFLIAFTTASSEAALPKALEVMERFGVPKNIVGFVLPTGYSFNLDGTTLYLSLASVFVAQLAGLELTFNQQLVMMLTLMLTSKGVAGVPRAALVVLAGTLTTFGLPLEGAAILSASINCSTWAERPSTSWATAHDGSRRAGKACSTMSGCARSSRAGRRACRDCRRMRLAVIGARGQLGAALRTRPRSARRCAARPRRSTSPTRRLFATLWRTSILMS
jgi:hypothetical protein